MIRNIIFDWSGTLVDDLPAVWEATNYVFRQAGLAELTLDQFRAEFCLPFTLFYERYTPHIPVPQLESWFHGHFRKCQGNVCELPHAREFLRFCRNRGFRTFLLSTVHSEHFAKQAAVTGFGEFLDRPYVEVVDKKARIHDILAENALVPAETIFIGDMQHDIETARHGGVFSCAVLTGYNRLDQLRASQPDLIVRHLGELKDLIECSNGAFPETGGGAVSTSQPIATVGALVFNSRDEVLMIRTHKWSGLWGIPGGKIRLGESSIDALRRELKEETNLDICDIEFVLVQDCIGSREFYRDAHFVLLNYRCRFHEPGDVKLNEEAEEFRWLSADDALRLPLNEPTRTLIQAVQLRSGSAPTAIPSVARVDA